MGQERRVSTGAQAIYQEGVVKRLVGYLLSQLLGPKELSALRRSAAVSIALAKGLSHTQ